MDGSMNKVREGGSHQRARVAPKLWLEEMMLVERSWTARKVDVTPNMEDLCWAERLTDLLIG